MRDTRRWCGYCSIADVDARTNDGETVLREAEGEGQDDDNKAGGDEGQDNDDNEAGGDEDAEISLGPLPIRAWKRRI